MPWAASPIGCSWVSRCFGWCSLLMLLWCVLVGFCFCCCRYWNWVFCSSLISLFWSVWKRFLNCVWLVLWVWVRVLAG